MNQSILSWIFKAEIGEGNLEALKEIASTCCTMTEEEPGVLAYEWSVSPDGKTLHLYECFQDSDAALAHLQHMTPLLPDVLALLTSTSMNCYGPASDTFKEAAKDLPITYFEQFAGFRR